MMQHNQAPSGPGGIKRMNKTQIVASLKFLHLQPQSTMVSSNEITPPGKFGMIVTGTAENLSKINVDRIAIESKRKQLAATRARVSAEKKDDATYLKNKIKKKVSLSGGIPIGPKTDKYIMEHQEKINLIMLAQQAELEYAIEQVSGGDLEHAQNEMLLVTKIIEYIDNNRTGVDIYWNELDKLRTSMAYSFMFFRLDHEHYRLQKPQQVYNENIYSETSLLSVILNTDFTIADMVDATRKLKEATTLADKSRFNSEIVYMFSQVRTSEKDKLKKLLELLQDKKEKHDNIYLSIDDKNTKRSIREHQKAHRSSSTFSEIIGLMHAITERPDQVFANVDNVSNWLSTSASAISAAPDVQVPVGNFCDTQEVALKTVLADIRNNTTDFVYKDTTVYTRLGEEQILIYNELGNFAILLSVAQQAPISMENNQGILRVASTVPVVVQSLPEKIMKCCGDLKNVFQHFIEPVFSVLIAVAPLPARIFPNGVYRQILFHCLWSIRSLPRGIIINEASVSQMILLKRTLGPNLFKLADNNISFTLSNDLKIPVFTDITPGNIIGDNNDYFTYNIIRFLNGFTRVFHTSPKDEKHKVDITKLMQKYYPGCENPDYHNSATGIAKNNIEAIDDVLKDNIFKQFNYANKRRKMDMDMLCVYK